MKHIALLIPGLDRIGGAERQAMQLATGLRRRGWRVHVVVLSGTGGEAATQLAEAGVDFLSLAMRKGWTDPRGWLRLNRWLRRERPDVLHAHLAHATWMARWSRLAAPVPVLVDTLHSTCTGSLGRRIGYRVSNRLTGKVTAVSAAVAAAHRDAGMASNIAVIPNSIDPHTFRPDALVRKAMRAEMHVGEDFLWLAAGRLEPVKDYPTLLAAMARLPAASRLVIAGTGQDEANLRGLRDRLGLGERVHFAGFAADIARWMQAADAFVLSSLWEGLPVAVLEAGACALPTVATGVPGTREAILDGETGWLTPSSDPWALAARMQQMMDATPGFRNAMGERARRHVLECFSLELALDRWEQLYADLLL
jgi:glycosyltransferase involved in cell wall biosynthesis